MNREMIDKFMGCITDRHTHINIKRLTIHEKAVLTACYVILKEHPGILIPMDKAYKTYTWICESIRMTPKAMKEFTLSLIYQL